MTLEFKLTLPRWTKWALGLGVPALALSILTAVALGQWTKPNDFAAGEVISAGEMNANFDTLYTAVNDLDDRAVPPGTMIWWWCDSPPCAAPAGWAIANGSNVNDPDSSLFGQQLPDMIDAFPMGVEPADVGSTGGENTSDLSHSHGPGSLTTGASGEHNHQWSRTILQGGSWRLRSFSANGTSKGDNIVRDRFNRGTGTQLGTEVLQAADDFYTTVDGEHNHIISGETGTADLSNHDNRPAYVGLLPLIKL